MESVDEGASRRDAIKKAAAVAATAGLVWSAPKVEGLSLRPNYAAAASAAYNWSTTINALGTPVVIPAINASPVVRDATAFANSFPFEPFVIIGYVQGDGLAGADFNIDAVNTVDPVNGTNVPVSFNPGVGITANNIVSTKAVVDADPAPAFPLQLNGRFSCR